MDLGVMLGRDPTAVRRQASLLNDRGLTKIWFGEVPRAGWGDPFISMTLATMAADVSVGTALTPSGLRELPVLANQVATLDALAPGRVTLGYGSGGFSRAVLGMGPIRIREFADEVAELRALLDGEPGDGRTNEASLLIASGGPRAAAIAGEYGDGLLATAEFDPTKITKLVEAAASARAEKGRGERFRVCVECGPLCVLRPGETVESERVVAMLQPAVSGYFGYYVGLGLDPDEVPPAIRDSYASFLAEAEDAYGSGREQKLLGIMMRNYLGRIPEHDHLVTPGVIDAATLTGSVEYLADRLTDMAGAGVTEVIVMRAFDHEWTSDEDLRDILDLAERVATDGKETS